MTAVSRCADFYAVVPAAGIGRRMGSELPKQYLPLNGGRVIEQTLGRLLEVSRVKRIAVAIAEEDGLWSDLSLSSHPNILRVNGGQERCHSVLNCLNALTDFADDDDWVLVHDVARPCIRPDDIDAMIDNLKDHSVGGILALPVSDTVKQVADGVILGTVDRSDLWLAQTPQMFRLGPLREALSRGVAEGNVMTDEASAMEWAGLQPKVVPGPVANIKITLPQDLLLAEYYCSEILIDRSNR